MNLPTLMYFVIRRDTDSSNDEHRGLGCAFSRNIGSRIRTPAHEPAYTYVFVKRRTAGPGNRPTLIIKAPILRA